MSSPTSTSPYALILIAWITTFYLFFSFRQNIYVYLEWESVEENNINTDDTGILVEEQISLLDIQNPTSSKEQPQKKPSVPTKIHIKKEPPQKILLIGSSSFKGELGARLTRKLRHHNLNVHRYAKVASGLARPDFFNWMEKVPELLEQYKPELVIIHLVGNDCQSLIHPDKSIDTLYSSSSWEEVYEQRIKNFLHLFQKNNVDVVVLGMSNVRSPIFRKRLLINNRILQKAVTSNNLQFIPLWAITSNERDIPLQSIKMDGITYPLFIKDGIHLSLPGAKYVTDHIYETLLAKYKWPSDTQKAQ